MTNDAPSGQEIDGRTDIEITVCANGIVNVRRPESDRAHSVFLGRDGGVTRCSCKGYHYRGECSHADAIAARPLVVASARAASTTGRAVATDGGQPVEDDDTEVNDDRFRLPEDPEHVEEPNAEHDAEAGEESDDEQHYAGGTAENTTSDVHGDEVPKRSERPDMGGGETTGVVDL